MPLASLLHWLSRGRSRPAEPADLSALALQDSPAQAPPELPTHDPDRPASPGHVAIWTPPRIAIEEEIWGPGFLNPGAGGELLRYASPLGLSPASSLLLLGAGAGGPPRHLAIELGAWINAYEADPDLAELAARRVHRAGDALAKRATVAAWSPHVPDLRPRQANHALAVDALRDALLEPILANISAALKPHGHIMLIETVAPAALDPADPALAAWARLEGRRPALPDPLAITRALKRLGYDVRVAEDISIRHMRLALAGWRHFVRILARERPAPERAAAVVLEAELWTRRLRLMHAGRIRLMRWHAIGRA
jgi:hypothetical protein